MSRMGAEMSEVGIGDLVFIRVIRAIRGLVGYGRTFSLQALIGSRKAQIDL